MKKIHKRSKRKKRRNLLIVLLEIISFFGVGYSVFHLVNWKVDTDYNKILKTKVDKIITIVNEENLTEDKKYKVDWETAKKTNEDTVAYLKVKNTNIDYLVVKADDNDYYLNHSFDKSKNINGWVFADYKNMFNGSDKNIVIFGHNIVDKSIFGSVPDMFKKDWYQNENNLNILFITEDGDYVYQIFSLYTISPEEYYIQTDFESDDDYMNFLNTVQRRSIYHFNVSLNITDRILTLSTCTPAGNARMVVHAKLLK